MAKKTIATEKAKKTATEPAAKKAAAKPAAKKKAAAKESTSKEVAVQQQTALAVPSSLVSRIAAEQNNVIQFSAEETKRAILRCLTTNSPQIDKHNEKFVPGSEAGDILVSTTKELFSSIKVIVVGYLRNFVEWIPKDSGGGFVGQHPYEASTIRGLERKGAVYILRNGNHLEETMAYAVLYWSDESEAWLPAVLFLKSMGLACGRDINTALQGQRVADARGKAMAVPPYANVIELGTKYDSNEKGVFYKFTFQNIRLVTEEEIADGTYDIAKRAAEAFIKSAGSDIDYTASAGEHGAGEKVDELC